MTSIKKEIIDTLQAMCQEQMVPGTWGNVSARSGEGIWITPSALSYDRMTEDDLVLLSPAGEVLGGRWKPSSEWRLHAEIYKARPDCHAVIHTHSVYATAFAVARRPILPVVEDCAQVVGGEVAVAEYALPGSVVLAKNAVAALGTKSAVLLANHGPVAAAGSLAEALKICRIVEKTAQVLVMAQSIGQVYELSDSDVKCLREQYTCSYSPKPLTWGEKK